MQKQVEDALKDVSIGSFHEPEELQREVDYYRAQSIASKMLTTGMITKEQFKLLTGLNLSSYAPRLETILTCMNGAF